MPHFFVSPQSISGENATIRGADVKHIKNVLRLGEGDSISLFDGEGNVYQGEIISVGKEVFIKIVAKKEVKAEHPQIYAAQAILKSDKMEWVVQKTTELGIKEIFTFTSKRTVPVDIATKKIARWQKIAIEASKQCGRPDIPKIHPPLSLNELIQRFDENFLRLIPWEGEEEKKIAPLLKPPTEKIVYVIGPEGGFDLEEIELAKQNGFIPINIGPRILKAETASIVTLTLLKHESGNL